MRTTLTQTFDTSFNNINSYDPLQINAGNMIKQYVDTESKLYAQPYKPEPYYIFLQGGSVQHNYPFVLSWSDDIDYIITSAGGGFNLNVGLTKFQRSTGIFTMMGTIRFTPAEGAGNNKTIYSVDATLDRWTAGTVSVSGTSVIGSGTTFDLSRISSGSRIGFGTTDPTLVTQWYEISSISSDTSLTLLTSPGTLPIGTSYVIEELRVLVLHRRTAAPLTAGGVHLIKGLNESVFGGFTIINQATTIDRLRAFYKLDPGNSVTAQYGLGFTTDEKISDTEQYLYVQNAPAGSTTQFQFQVFNIRANLTLSSGIDVTAWQYDTGSVIITGTFGISTAVMRTLSSGTTAGVKCVFVLTSTRLYGCPISSLIPSATTFLTYTHIQVPPGTTNTYQGSTYGYFSPNDTTQSIIFNGNQLPLPYTNEPFGNPGNRYFFPFVGRIKNPSTSIDATESFTCSNSTGNIWIHKGIMYNIVGLTTNNYIYAIPLDADYTTALSSNQYITTTILNTPGCVQFYSVNLIVRGFFGSDTLGSSADRCKLFVRTSGILDNSGTWIEVPRNGDISTIIAAANQIQVAVTWEVMGLSGSFPWVYGVNVTYEDGSQDSHYLPSLAQSSAALRMFAFLQAQLWGGTIPNLRIRLYNATTSALIIDDDVNSSLFGVWEYSSDGGTTWLPWSTSADVLGNYIRYTASSLPAATTIRALLTIA
jgi:hypothetical protein